jgi:hypothetical protein
MCNPFVVLRANQGPALVRANINHGQADEKELAPVNPVLSTSISRLSRRFDASCMSLSQLADWRICSFPAVAALPRMPSTRVNPVSRASLVPLCRYIVGTLGAYLLVQAVNIAAVITVRLRTCDVMTCVRHPTQFVTACPYLIN